MTMPLKKYSLLLFILAISVSKNSTAQPLINLVPQQREPINEQTVTFVPISYDDIIIPIFAGTGLPPDPGNAGDITIEGIDSDSDGIRDDVERRISLMYPGHPSVRTYSYIIAMSLQDSINNPTSVSQQNTSMAKISAAHDCLKNMDLEVEGMHVGIKEIMPIVLNTFQRSYSYLNAMKHFRGKAILNGSKCSDL